MDDISLWIKKRDVEPSYFEADDECEDPEADPESYAGSEDDLEEDNGEYINLLSDEQLALIPALSDEDFALKEMTGRNHMRMNQYQVNSIFAWIIATTVDISQDIIGITNGYKSVTDEQVDHDALECFQHLLQHRYRTGLEVSPSQA